MRLIRSLRDRRIRTQFPELHGLYAGDHGPDEIRRIQLERFNRVWEAVARRSPYYAALREQRRLPGRFESWAEFSAAMPVLDRGTVKANAGSMALSGAAADYCRITGGTTAEPLRLAAWHREDRLTTANSWFARSWFDTGASDRLFLLWGHSHLFGRGIGGRINGLKRRLKDRCFGYVRYSAYDLGSEKLRDAGRAILRARPGYVLGYATALHRLAMVNRDRSGEFRRLGLKVAIATGESFPAVDSSRRIADVFGCPVAMEYGAVETGTIAHQRPTGEFQVFWGSYYVEGLPSPDYPDASEIVVTALFPRLTPLIRYRLGDLISTSTDREDAGIRFDKVIGRSNDGILVGESGFVHSEAFTHALRDIDRIHAFQVVQAQDREITINYTSNDILPNDATRLIRRRLRKLDGRLGSIDIKWVPSIESTVAGKSKRIVSRATATDRDAS